MPDILEEESMLTDRRAALTLPAVLLLVALTAGSVAAQERITVTDVGGDAVLIEDTSRVATLGGVVTETAYALGAADKIVAVDDSSFYPPEALAEKPSFGYYRFLSAEPVLAADPSLIIGNEETGPPEVVAQLRSAGVPILLVPDGNDVDGARQLIRTMGQVLGADVAADALIARLDDEVAAAAELVAGATEVPRVLFVLKPPQAPTLIAGGDTAAGSMITLAGGENIFPGFDSYVPMTPEGIVETAPDIILTTDDSLREYGGLDAFLADPGVAATPAAANGRVVSMDRSLPARLRPAHRPGHRRPREAAASGVGTVAETAQRAHAGLRLTVLAVAAVASIVVAMGIGAVAIAPQEVLAVLAAQLGIGTPWEFSTRQETVLTAIRVPRVLATAIVGAAWATAGVGMQGLYRTPLADPALVGIGGGAALGAALGLGLALSVDLVTRLPGHAAGRGHGLCRSTARSSHRLPGRGRIGTRARGDDAARRHRADGTASRHSRPSWWRPAAHRKWARWRSGAWARSRA